MAAARRKLAPPTLAEREAARRAAAALRRAIADPSTMGAPAVAHIDYSRPRRAEWITTWANLSGFWRVNGQYRHDCLPGWLYERSEIVSELIPDLEALAGRGERPTVATGHLAADRDQRHVAGRPS